MRALAAVFTALSLVAAPWASQAQQPPPAAAGDALDGVDVERVYRAGLVYRRRWLDTADDLAVCEVGRRGAERKLATRTATVVRDLVVPPPVPDDSGISGGTVVAIALSAAALAALATFFIVRDQGDPVVIVNGPP